MGSWRSRIKGETLEEAEEKEKSLNEEVDEAVGKELEEKGKEEKENMEEVEE